jgi:ribosome-binding protein aMBF1 (putative translation factor)
MSVKSEPQVIMIDGKPAFAVIPWLEYLKLTGKTKEKDETGVWFPHDVVDANLRGDNMIKAWREHFGFSQSELAERAGMKQPALARLETGAVAPRRATLVKLAKAMGLDVAQLID